MIQTKEKLYVLARKSGSGELKIAYYTLAGSSKDVWEQVIETEQLGTGQTKMDLQACGWKACPADLSVHI